MKNFSKIILTIALFVMGVFVTACGESNKKEIKLSSNEVVINLTEEVKSATITAELVAVKVDSLSFSYDNTCFLVDAKKTDNQKFDITISSRGEVGCEDVEVTVYAGANATAKFKVTIVVPVTDIVATSDLTVSFNGAETAINLYNTISFVPESTKQTAVAFEIYDRAEQRYVTEVANYAKISGNYIIISENFDDFDNDILVVVSSVQNQELRKEFAIKVVPNTIYLADQVTMMVDYGAGKDLLTQECNLTIENATLETFEVYVYFPKTANLFVEVDSNIDEQMNIMQYLNVQKRRNEVDNNADGVNETVENIFTFSSLNLKSAKAKLYFKFSYADNNSAELKSNFVKIGEEVKDFVNVNISVPVKELVVLDKGIISNKRDFAIYNSYVAGMAGTEVVVAANPLNSTEQTLIIQTMTNIKVFVNEGAGIGYKEVEEGGSFTSGTSLFIVGNEGQTNGKIVICSKFDLAIKIELNFTIKNGATALGFAISDDPAEGTAVAKDIAVECGNPVGGTVLLYAPGATIDDLIYPNELVLEPLGGGYFRVSVSSNVVGVATHTIKTNNGFAVTLTVQTIQTLNNFSVNIASTENNVAGIGKYSIEDGSLKNLSLKYGYNLPIEIVQNENANISAIKYYFVDATLGVAPYTSVYVGEYKNFELANLADYKITSGIIDASMLKESSLIAAAGEGKVKVRLVVSGYKVEGGVVVPAGYDELGNEINEEVIVKEFFVEVYRPAKDIVASSKTIEIRSESELDEKYFDEATKSVNVTVVADEDQRFEASYNKVYIDRGSLIEENGKPCIKFEQGREGSSLHYIAKMWVDTNTLEINIKNIPNTTSGFITQTITLFAADFYTEDVNSLTYVKQRYSVKTYEINLNITVTKRVEDVNVTSLKLQSDETNETDGRIKTYERIYLDTFAIPSGSTNVYKIITEVLPISAFDKSLVYTFVPDVNVAEGLVDVSKNDGTVYYSGAYGGTGKIYIKPADPKSAKVTIVIPVVVADGNSEKTAYEISNLNQVVNPNKHYRLKTSVTLEIGKTLFENDTFMGGLYGEFASIKLNNCSLFKAIGKSAVVENLTIYGSAYGAGFVANENAGTIKNVNVVAFVGNNGYIPSLLTAHYEEKAVGGLVGVNKAEGKIIDSSFAGTILANASADIYGLAGKDESEDGIINSFVITATYEYLSENKDRLITLNGNSFINGIVLVNYDASGNEISRDIAGFSDDDYKKTPVYLTGNEYINTSLEHSIGKEAYNFGIVYYYKAKDFTEQEKVEKYNQIPISSYSYTNAKGETVNVEGIINSTNDKLKVLVYNMDGTRCDFVSVSGNFLNVRGTGLFKLEIFSEFNYLESISFNMLSIYYMSEFGIYNGNNKLLNNSELTLLKGYRKQIQSKTTAEVDGVKIATNDFAVMFNFEELDASKYITGTNLGNHTINTSFENNEELTIVLDTKMGEAFNKLLNEKFCNNYKVTLKAINGTTKLQTTAKEGNIEPKDGIVIDAIITTDNIIENTTTDYIDISTIYITNDTGYTYSIDEALEIFDIYVVGPIKIESATNQFKYQITISLKDGVKHLATYINRTYTIRIYASSPSISDNFEAYAEFELTINNQSLSNVATTIYNFTSYNGDLAYVQQEPPVSVIRPDDSALLVVDLFPNYASFDYVEISATSSTTAGLAFRVRDRVGNVYHPNTSSKVEALTYANGIRVYNKFNYNANSQYVGSYYIEIWTINTLDIDTLFTINASVYLNGEQLNKTSTISLFVNAPERPEININGETTIYAYPGEEFTASLSVAADQTISSVAIVNDIGDELEFSYTLEKVISENESGLTRYNLIFTVPNENSTKHMVLTVKSEKYENGSFMETESSIYIFMVDFKAPADSIKIFGEIDGIYNASSIKYTSLSLNANLLAKFDDAGKNTAVDQFNSNYYYKNPTTGFEFGSDYSAPAYNLLASLYYVNGNTYSPVAIFDSMGRFVRFAINDYNKYITFNLIEKEVAPGKTELTLVVKGKEQAGEVPLVLRMYYTVMGNLSQTAFVYEHNFTIINSIYTTEDMPIEIASAETFLKIQEAEKPYDYILNSDIYLYEHEIIQDTSKIKSLDGNNYTIYIMSFMQKEETSPNYALFDTISSITTIKNLTVSYYYLSEITLLEEAVSAKIAGLAIVNNGVIYNSEVMAFAGAEKSPTHNVFGLKIDSYAQATTNITVAGFVLENRNSITHSRVGGTQKQITTFKEISDEPVLTTKIVKNEMFTIRASGTISGFVHINSGVIASSYAKNINIINTYNKNQTVVSAGFVNSNEGTISMSYAEGAKSENAIQALAGGIEASGIIAGFVYSNISKISDSYSNIMLHSPNGQVGRLGAGFVYYNGPEAQISTSYSFSSIAKSNTTQLNFAGITELMQYNNFGKIENCYYYANEDMKAEAVEDLFYTNITAIENVEDELNFYGFSFASKYDTSFASTWKMESSGPKLTSADDIAYSVRYKTENPNKESTLDYLFVYDEKYELGTKNNPIIIRDAVEFNGVFGGYKNTNTDIENSFDTVSKKVFGAYRLVNNISLLDLIIEDKEDSNYKYNLASTTYTLSGKYKDITNKPGSFNGNGLTISNLAISNEETTGGENYGLFKAIENGASFANVNIVLSKGGVKADNTTFVGTIAGTLSDSAIVNIHISSNSEEDHTDIIGANIVGGAVGRVIKNSYVFGITVNNISVLSTYYQYKGVPADKNSLHDNMYKRLNGYYKDVSIAGGVFGVVDVYTPEQETGVIVDVENITFANIQSLKTKGSMTIEAMTVGGVVGYVGQNVVAKDLSLTISKTPTKQAKLSSYYCYAGGVVGFNLGYLYQIKAEHDEAWQKQIETTMANYYSATDAEKRAAIDRGNLSLFISGGENKFAPGVIGGLVGVMANGTIEVGYSKLNVINEKSVYAGGAVGFANELSGIIVPTQARTGEENAEAIIEFTEVYATGDVYAGAEGKNRTAYNGGVVGYNGNASAMFTKVNALNYWGDNVLKASSDKIFTQIAFSDNKSITYNVGGLGIIKEVKFDTEENPVSIERLKAKTPFDENADKDENYTEIQGYYGYTGVAEDSGARVDIPFVNNEWYYSNWERKNTELYPKIRYTNPTSIFEIFNKYDFTLFDKYGNNPNAVFIVTNPGLIDCTGVNRTYPILKGTLVGLYSGSGFQNMSNPLFKNITGKISSLNFAQCTAPIGTVASNEATFTYLNYRDCNFSKVGTVSGQRCIAGIVYQVNNPLRVSFNNININDSFIKHSSSTMGVNAGMLYAVSTGDESGENKVLIEKITIINASVNVIAKESDNTQETNIGIVFGKSNNFVAMEVNVDVKDNSSADSKDNYVRLYASEDDKQTTVSYFGGKSTTATITNCVISSADLLVECQGGCHNINVGGFIGSATNLEIKVEKDERCKIYDARIEIDGMTSTAAVRGAETQPKVSGKIANIFVGGIAGNITAKVKFIVDAENNLLIGSGNSNITVNAPDAISALYAGGVFGTAKGIETSITKYIKCSSDIIIIGKNGSTTSETNGLYIGGFIGEVNSAENITRIVCDGAITFDEIINSTSYVGGVIGRINASEKTVNIASLYALGDIVVSNAKLQVSKNNYIGGLIGQIENGTVELTSDCYSLTTIVNKKEFGELIIADAVVTGKPEILADSEGDANIYYSSSVNVCISDATGNVINQTYAFVADKLSINKLALDPKLIEALNVGSDENKGTKLNPLVFSEIYEELNIDGSYILEGVAEASLEASEGISIKGLKLRKTYVIFDNLDLLENAINKLENVVLFADGEIVYTKKTFINHICANSVVSGITIKSDISLAQASFAIKNDGIVYICSIEAPLEYFYNDGANLQQIQTNFTAKISASDNVAGFIFQNTGYIFGSHSNVTINILKSSSVAGFVYSNSGYIEYSYANGNLVADSDVEGVKLELFVNNEKDEESGAVLGTVSNCYTIFADNAGVKTENLTLCDGCAYEQDSSEAVVYKENEKVESTELFKKSVGNYLKNTDETINFGYPVLSSPQFNNMPYTKPITKVYEITVDSEDGLVGSKYKYYTNIEPETDKVEVKIIPNLTVLKNANSGNYVVSRTLNFGYYTKNLTEGSVIEQKEYSEAYISSIGGEENAVNINFNNNILKNISLSGCNLISSISASSSIKNAIIENLSLTNTNGAIGTNNGTVEAVVIQGSIKLSIASTEDITVGILAATNAGTINSCSMSGNLSVTKLDVVAEKTAIIGGIVGESSGQINSSKLTNSEIILETNENKNITLGGIAGTSTGTILSCGVLGFKINIITAGTVKLGGIVGEMTGGSVETCYTNENSTITAGTSEKQDASGNYFATKTAYAGGIVGFNKDITGVITNCENKANITADAVWNRVGTEQKYKFVEEQNNSIYVYMKMKSEAYAGGISGNGLGEGSNYLSNKGTVKGGFEAWKPMYRISTNDQPTTGETALKQGLGIGFTIGGAAAATTGVVLFGGKALIGYAVVGITKAFGGVASMAGPIGWAIGGAALLIGGVTAAIIAAGKAKEAQEQADSANLYVYPILGNSTNYVLGMASENRPFLKGSTHKATDFEKVDENGTSVDSISQTVIQSALTGYNKNNVAKDNITEKFVRKFLQNEKAEEVRKVTLASIEEPVPYDYGKMDYSGVIGEQVLSELYYDIISPNRGNATKIYSTTLNYTEQTIDKTTVEMKLNDDDNQITSVTSGVIARSVNNADTNNKYLNFIPDTTPKYYEYSKCATHSDQYVGGTFRDFCKSCNPKPTSQWNECWDDEGNLLNATPDSLVVQDNTITLRDAKYWSNLVYTINSWFKGTLTNGENIIGGPNKPLKVVIALNGAQTKINVGYDQIEQFVGEFIVEPNQEGGTVIFENLKFKMNALYNADELKTPQNIGIFHKIIEGETKEQSQTTISGVNYTGNVEIVENADGEIDKIKTINYGTIVSEVNTGASLNLTNSSVNINLINIENSILHMVKNFGGVVGIINGSANIESVNANIKLFEGLADVVYENLDKDGNEVINTFGGIVANNRGEIILSEVNSNLAKVILRSNINTAGGIIGNNQGSANFRSAVDVIIKTFNIISSGNVYVGGAVGKNTDELNINSAAVNYSTVFENENAVISADVLQHGNFNAYAGGLVAYTESSLVLNNTLIGCFSGTGNDAIMYVLAGFNNSEFSNSKIVPKEAYAGRSIGYCAEDYTETATIVNVVARSNSYNADATTTEFENLQVTTTTNFENYGFTVEDNKISYSVNMDVCNDAGNVIDGYKNHINNYSDVEVKGRSYYEYANTSTQGKKVYEYDLKFTTYFDVLTYSYQNSNVVKTAELKELFTLSYKVLITDLHYNLQGNGNCLVRIIQTSIFEVDDKTFEPVRDSNGYIKIKECYNEVYSGIINDTAEKITINVNLNELMSGIIAMNTIDGTTKDEDGNAESGTLTSNTTTLKSEGFTISFNNGGNFTFSESISATRVITKYTFSTNSGTTTVQEDTSTNTDTITRTIFEFNVAGDYQPNQLSGGNKFDNGNNYKVDDKEGIITQDTVINGYLVPAVGNGDKYVNEYKGTIGGRDVVIINTIEQKEGFYQVTDYIFEKLGAEFAHRGTLAYRIVDTNVDNIKILTKLMDASVFATRYDSYLPIFPRGEGYDYMDYVYAVEYNLLRNNQMEVLSDAFSIAYAPTKLKCVISNGSAKLVETMVNYTFNKDGSLTATEGTPEETAMILEDISSSIVTVSGAFGYNDGTEVSVNCCEYYTHDGVIVGYKVEVSREDVEVEDPESPDGTKIEEVITYNYYYFNAFDFTSINNGEEALTFFKISYNQE